MDSIKLVTFQNIQVEYKLAGMGNRILGRIIDNAIRIAYMIIFAIIITRVSRVLEGKNEVAKLIYYSSLFIFSIPFLFYSLIFEVFMNGQSPGKKSFKMKVASLDGTPVTLWQYILRWIFLIIDNATLGLIPMALSRNDQRFGDLVAGTTVISLEEKKQDNLFSGMVFPENYIAKYPEAYQLSDKDIFILKDVVFQAHSQGNLSNEILSKASQKIKELLNIDSREEDLIFLQQIIKDYTFHFEKAP